MRNRVASRTYGTVSADRQKEMTGLKFVQGLADGALPLNTMAGGAAGLSQVIASIAATLSPRPCSPASFETSVTRRLSPSVALSSRHRCTSPGRICKVGLAIPFVV